jgi:hypothetical protein
MTNGDLGGRVTSEVEARVAAAYHSAAWTSHWFVEMGATMT